MADCEDRKKKQVLGDIKTCKMKLDLKYLFHFFFYLNAKKRVSSRRREDFEDKNVKLGISD